MYCSVVRKVNFPLPSLGEGAVNVEGYHWDRKPYGSPYSRQKKMGPPSAKMVEEVIVWECALEGVDGGRLFF